MKSIYTLLLLFCVLEPTLAQGDYYTLPKNRTKLDGQITLPNIKTEDLYLYLGAKGGYKVQGNQFTNSHKGRLISSPSNYIFWEIYLGLNHKDKWNYEISYLHNPLYLQWRAKDLPQFLPFTADKVQRAIQMRVKKRVATLDRVTRKTRLNLMAGLKYAPAPKAGNQTNFDVIIPYIYPDGTPADTLFIKTQFLQPRPVLSAIAGLEIMSRVAEQLEIGLSTNLMLDPKTALYSTIDIQNTGNNKILSDLNLNKASITIGINIRWNFFRSIQYLPEKP